MDRRLYLVSYDVSDSSALRRVAQLVKAYAIGGQKSFYECWMTKAEAGYLYGRICREIDPATDRMHIFQLDPRMLAIFLGQAKRMTFDPFMVA